MFWQPSTKHWFPETRTKWRQEAFTLKSSLASLHPLMYDKSKQLYFLVCHVCSQRHDNPPMSYHTVPCLAYVILNADSLITQMKNSFKAFGIKDDSKNILCVILQDKCTDNKVGKREGGRACDHYLFLQFSLLQAKIKGNLIPLSNLPSLHQREEIIKVNFFFFFRCTCG